MTDAQDAHNTIAIDDTDAALLARCNDITEETARRLIQTSSTGHLKPPTGFTNFCDAFVNNPLEFPTPDPVTPSAPDADRLSRTSHRITLNRGHADPAATQDSRSQVSELSNLSNNSLPSKFSNFTFTAVDTTDKAVDTTDTEVPSMSFGGMGSMLLEEEHILTSPEAAAPSPPAAPTPPQENDHETLLALATLAPECDGEEHAIEMQKRKRDQTEYLIKGEKATKKAKPEDIKVNLTEDEMRDIAGFMEFRDKGGSQFRQTHRFLLRLTIQQRSKQWAHIRFLDAFPAEEGLASNGRFNLHTLRLLQATHNNPINLSPVDDDDVQIEDLFEKEDSYLQLSDTEYWEFKNSLENLIHASYDDFKTACSGDVARDTVLVVVSMCDRWKPVNLKRGNSKHQSWYIMILHNVYDLLKCFNYDPTRNDVEEWLLNVWGCFAHLAVSFYLAQNNTPRPELCEDMKIKHKKMIDATNPCIESEAIKINASFCTKLFQVRMKTSGWQSKLNVSNIAWVLLHVMDLCGNLFASGKMVDRMKHVAQDKKLHGDISLVGLIDHCAKKMKFYQQQLSGLVADKLLVSGVLAESEFFDDDNAKEDDTDYLKWMHTVLNSAED